MKNLFTKIIILFIVFALIITYASCQRKSDDTIKIGVLEGPSAISFIPLIDKPHLLEGKKIEIIVKSEPAQLQSMMSKQELDFVVIPTVMAANLYNKGIKYRMVACPIWGSLYIVTNNQDVQYYEDLYDKDIFVFGNGTTADLLLQYNLRQKDISCKSINYSFKSNQQIADALLAKDIEIAVLSEPLVSLVMDDDPGIYIVEQLCVEKFMENPERNSFIQSAFMVSDRFIKNNSYLISDICNIYAQSCNYVRENLQHASNLLVKNNHARSYHVASQCIELCNIEYVSAFAIQKEIQTYLQIFHDLDPAYIGGKQPKSDFIYHAYR